MFGFNAQIFALSVLAVSYVFLFTEKLNRAVTVLLGTSLLIFVGILSQETAISAIDFNTLALLIGMMIIVGISEKSGMFQCLAIFSVKIVRASPRGLMIMLALITAVLSALLDNVTTVLLIVPVTFQITRNLKIKPYPFLLMEIFASNIGGTATLIGDPPNILIGSAIHLSFMDFVYELTPLVIVCLFILIVIFDLFYSRKLTALPSDRAELLRINPTDMIVDVGLFKKSLFVLILVLSGFIMAEYLHLQNGTIALFSAALILLFYTQGDAHMLRDRKVEDAFSLVDWTTIFFFAGLFAIVFALETTGVLDILAQRLIVLTQNSVQKATFSVLWIAAIVSTFIDNIPFVATMIPTLKSMEVHMGGREAMMPVWWALSVGACFGGNGSLIAASANVIVAGLASKENEHISFAKFLIFGLPIMLISTLIAMLYFYAKHFI